MKKNYFMLAAATMMLAACAETDLVNEVNAVVEPQAIGFETFANKATRDTENSKESYKENDLENHHTTFKVWASKQLADASGTYVDVYAATKPGVVTYNTSWGADPLKYWDKAAANYYFYAAAPSGLNWAYNNATADNGSTGFLKLENYTLSGTNIATSASTTLINTWKESTGDKDLMIAAKCEIGNLFYNKPAPGAVNLDFIHILSKLNIAVQTTEDKVKLVALNVCGLNNKSSFTENADLDDDSDFDDADKEALVHGSTKRWGTATPDGTYTLAAAGTPLALTEDATAVYTHEYLIMPQLQLRQDDCKGSGTAPTNDAYIYIEYTIDDEPYKAYYGLAEVFGIAKGKNLAFNEGWQNTLTISIEPDAITFTGDVAVWDDNIGSGSLDID